MSLPIRQLAAKGLDVAWGVLGDVLRDINWFEWREDSSTFERRAFLQGLFLTYAPGQVNGADIKALDVRVIFRAKDFRQNQTPYRGPEKLDKFSVPELLRLGDASYSSVANACTIAHWDDFVGQVTQVAHGFASGRWVAITGCAVSAYNLVRPITVINADTYQYDLAVNPGVDGGAAFAQDAGLFEFQVQSVHLDPSQQVMTVQARPI